MHPYMSKFHGKEDIIFVNPETDFFSDGICTENFLEEKFPPSTYDLAHIHFSFDQLPISEFEKLLKYFKRIKKPIVWTCHSKESQRGGYQASSDNYRRRCSEEKVPKVQIV